ncbi:coiled-coil domain-containing protein [Zopfochytrium polystomum]|nr:coiled-coil domain-containing protein [Zopfochytrium polystomum]
MPAKPHDTAGSRRVSVAIPEDAVEDDAPSGPSGASVPVDEEASEPTANQPHDNNGENSAKGAVEHYRDGDDDEEGESEVTSDNGQDGGSRLESATAARGGNGGDALPPLPSPAAPVAPPDPSDPLAEIPEYEAVSDEKLNAALDFLRHSTTTLLEAATATASGVTASGATGTVDAPPQMVPRTVSIASSFATGAESIANEASTQLHAQTTAQARLQQEHVTLTHLIHQSRNNERLLIHRVRELTAQVTAGTQKVHAALALSRRDREVVVGLKKEVARAWELVETATQKEARAREAVSRLKMELEVPVGGTSKAAHMIEQEQEQAIERLMQQVSQLKEQLELLKGETAKTQTDNKDLRDQIKSLEAERQQRQEDLESLTRLVVAKKDEVTRVEKLRKKLEDELKSANEVLLKKEAESAAKVAEASRAKEVAGRLETQIKEERARTDREAREREAAGLRANAVLAELEATKSANDRLRREGEDREDSAKEWEAEYWRYKSEHKVLLRERELLQKSVKSLEEAKAALETERNTLQSECQRLSHEEVSIQRQLNDALKHVDSITKERDVAQRNFVKATGTTQRHMGLVKLSDQAKRTLEQELMGYKEEASKMRKLIFSLEKDRDRHITQVHTLEADLIAAQEDIKLKDLLTFDARKKITDLERKLREQQALYENVRADRNLYSKNLLESHDEITEMRRKLKIMGHQIEQLKEEISVKDGELAKQHFEHQKLEKEKEGLSAQIGKLQQQHADALKTVQNHLAEEGKLHRIIAEGDAERSKQRKAYDNVIQERDILGTQLIRRNDEIALLYEKIRIQMSTLNKGEIQYRERQEDIRVLKLEIKRVRREKAILQSETQNLEGLRGEIYRLQREILKERTRVKVLEEELENPMNVHRWRKLSGSDPSTYELITKIQALQKRLIAKTEEVVEREMVISQKDKMYLEVKELLQRQPGPEVLEELRAVKEAVKTKMRESKSLASELNMYHSQVNEYKYEIERLTHDMQDLKKRYFDLKKRSDAKLKKVREAVGKGGGMSPMVATAAMAAAAAAHALASSGTAGPVTAAGGGGAEGPGWACWDARAALGRRSERSWSDTGAAQSSYASEAWPIVWFGKQ